MGEVQNEKLHKLNSAIYYWRDKMQENMTDGICSTNNGGDKCKRNFTCLIRYLVYNVKEILIHIYIYMCVRVCACVHTRAHTRVICQYKSMV